jgi:ABC-type transporter Mla maintaining outer membrane lipid asymmetry ATPase subunit MlaF
MADKEQPHIVVNDMTLAYGSNVVQRNVSFTVNHGDVFIIMGGSGCGKSTVMRGLTGLKPPSAGTIHYDGVDFYGTTDAHGPDSPQPGGHVSKRCPVEFHDPGRKRGPAA